ncbi:MAG: hypothetical protein VX533_02335, partial [Pseudomonadota bacterium]|nr:hypothetical protein [Pseudomonadota bacterium]
YVPPWSACSNATSGNDRRGDTIIVTRVYTDDAPRLANDRFFLPVCMHRNGTHHPPTCSKPSQAK